MSKWKRTKAHRIARKDQKWTKSIDWSRMIHKWFVIDLFKKREIRDKLRKREIEDL